MGPALYLELHVGSLRQGLGCDPSGTVLNCVGGGEGGMRCWLWAEEEDGPG